MQARQVSGVVCCGSLADVSRENQKEVKILVVAPAWVGDMVMSLSLIEYLKSKNPDSIIDVLAPASTFPLIARMPGVNEGILLEAGHGELLLDYRQQLGKHLSKRKYDQAYVLPNSLKSALVPFFANIDIRTGYRGEFRFFLINDMHLLNKRLRPLLVERFVGLATGPNKPLPKPIPSPRLQVDQVNKKRILQELDLEIEPPVFAICPGAEYGNAKKWPEDYYSKLALEAISLGYQVWIFGSGKDKNTGSSIKMQIGSDSCVDLTGRTSLLDVVDLLSLCQIAVTNDSGLMHISCALGVETIAIYGSTTTEFTPPLSSNAKTVSLKLSCSPCFKRDCPLGHTNCLTQLTPEIVLEKISLARMERPGDKEVS